MTFALDSDSVGSEQTNKQTTNLQPRCTRKLLFVAKSSGCCVPKLTRGRRAGQIVVCVPRMPTTPVKSLPEPRARACPRARALRWCQQRTTSGRHLVGRLPRPPDDELLGGVVCANAGRGSASRHKACLAWLICILLHSETAQLLACSYTNPPSSVPPPFPSATQARSPTPTSSPSRPDVPHKPYTGYLCW